MFVVLGNQTWRLYQAEKALEIMESTLEGSYSREEGFRVIKIGLLCVQVSVAAFNVPGGIDADE